jgi:hypothetical protein
MGAVAGLRVGVAFCTRFRRRSWVPVWGGPGDLPDAHRAPASFSEAVLNAGGSVEWFAADERVETTLAALPASPLADVDLLWVTTHGVFDAAGYRAILRNLDWRCGTGLAGPQVVVFDTCHLIDRGRTGWEAAWGAHAGSLRLALGFEGEATVDELSSSRGAVLVEQLDAGATYADAWSYAVISTSPWAPGRRTDVPVAMGLGCCADIAGQALRLLPGAGAAPTPCQGGPRQVAVA